MAVLERSQSKLEERLEALEQGGEQFEKMAALIESLTEKVSALEAKLGMDPAEAEAFAAEAKAKAKAREPSADKSSSGSPPGASSLKSDEVSESAAAPADDASSASAAAPASADDENSASAAAAASADDEKSASAAAASANDDSSASESAAAAASADDESSASAAAPAPADASSDDDSSALDAADPPAEASSNDDSTDDENSASEAADTAEAADDESGEASVEDAGGTAQEKPQRPAKRMRPPTKTAMRQSLETLVGEEIALKERSKHVDITDGTFFQAELHDDDGLLVGTMIADVEATVKLACMLMMLPEDEVQEQLAANEASEDSVETMSEIFNTMSATINNVKSNPHVRTTPLAPLNPQEFEWVKTTKRRIDVDVGCGGVISICAV